MTAKKEKIKLTVEKRKITGRKVKALRREGILPANIYGKKEKSLSVQLEAKSFLPVFKEVGETGLIELKVADEKEARPVLIHNVQFHPVDEIPLHVDFYQVDLKEKVTTKVPVELIGESPAVKDKIGILIQPLSEVEVEALPADLPEKIEVDISVLDEVGKTVTVADLKLGDKIEIKTHKDQVIVKAEEPREEVIETPEATVTPGEMPATEQKVVTEEVEASSAEATAAKKAENKKD